MEGLSDDDDDDDGDGAANGAANGANDSSNEHERFRLLYEATYSCSLRYARRRIDEPHASDVAAEVFAIAWRRRHELPRKPLPYLYGITRRVLANQRRGSDRALHLYEKVAAASTAAWTDRTAGDPAETIAAREPMATAFARLPDDDREVLALVVWEGLNARQAATVLGCSTGAIAMRLHRARHRLPALLDETETEV